jgi:AraC-like DNA-binding protein
MLTELKSVPHTDRTRIASLRTAIEHTINRFAATHDTYETPVPGLSVATITSALPPTAYVYEPSLCVCARGTKRVLLGAANLSYDENNFFLTAIGLPTIISVPDATVENPYTALQISLDLNIARQMIADMDMLGSEVVRIEPGMAIGPLTEDLLDAVARLVQLIDHPHDAAILSSLIHREILYRVLSGPSGERLRQIAQIGSQYHQISLAISWLRANFSQRLRIEELAEISGLAISTLHRHFKKLTTMSPLQFQKQLCLHEARRLMLVEGLDAGSAAFRVGYESATQFNREYSRLFGKPPFRDVMTLRSSR